VPTPTLLRAGNPGPLTGEGTNTWLFDGREPTLVDAGVGAAGHLEAIARVLGGRPLARVLVTHGHLDHASGVAALRAQWPDLEARKFLIDGEAGWVALVDGDRVRAGDRELHVLHTPGHAPDHVCLWDGADRAIYGGDMVIDGATVLIPAGRGGNLRQYLTSLERLAALQPARIYPGHGPIIERPLELISACQLHRRQREAQVLAAIDRVGPDPDALVAEIYSGLPEAVRPAARMTVVAHLEKLREDDRLR
jgi:glyoxylase-like metal-dependent hydrolase (beta-lactamase superfamily II)